MVGLVLFGHGALLADRPGEEWGVVVHVSDGDTVVVQLGGRAEKVRLIGIDTPEIGWKGRPAEPFAGEAATFVRRRVGGRRVELRNEPRRADRDAYGRLLRYLYLEDGTCLNAELIERGYGRALLRFPFARSREFKALERQARAGRRGLWAGRLASASPP